MANKTSEAGIDAGAAPEDGRWVGAGLLRENGSWIFLVLYGIGTMGTILIGLTYTRYALGLWTWILTPFVVGLLIPVVRRRLHLLLLGAVCLVATLALGEALFRLRHFGPDSLTHPFQYSPASTTSVRGFIDVSADPVRGYELSRGFDSLRNGKRYSVNDWGYRDRGFAGARELGVLRILVLGDSFAMATGVEAEQGVSRVLEQRLNEMGVRAEVYNLAVSGYDLDQIARVLETDGVRLSPDIVIVAQWAFVAHERSSGEEIDWEQMVSEAQSTMDRQHAVRYFSFLRALAPRLGGLERRIKRLAARLGLPEGGSKGAQPLAMPMFLDRMVAAGREHGFRPAVLMLRPLDFRSSTQGRIAGDRDRVREWCDERGVLFLDTFDAFPKGSLSNECIIYPGNSHPNAESHARYAGAAAEQLRGAGALEAPASEGR